MVEPIPSDFIPERVFPEDFDPEGLFEPDDNRPTLGCDNAVQYLDLSNWDVVRTALTERLRLTSSAPSDDLDAALDELVDATRFIESGMRRQVQRKFALKSPRN